VDWPASWLLERGLHLVARSASSHRPRPAGPPVTLDEFDRRLAIVTAAGRLVGGVIAAAHEG